jgi:CubicO group peptidase (beta-lactamase class C family)
MAIVLAGAAWFAWDVVTDDQPSTQGDRFDQIDDYVTDQMHDSRIPGASLAIVENATVVHGVGYGDDGRGNAITPETPFWIGSNTKSITALAIMQLSETGAVDLDAPVRTYLPEFRVADATASDQITVRHLLNQPAASRAPTASEPSRTPTRTTRSTTS